MKKLKNYLFGLLLVTSGSLIIASGGGGGCFACDGSGKSECYGCVNGSTDFGTCTICNGRGNYTCTVCDGSGD